ncbi:MAG: hypothetical protein K2L38_02410, partial [Dysosmobacter sp.]|nr:hypothetical protein [Dysosmobacter sp.]
MEHQAVYLGVRRRLGICQKGEKAQEARLAEKHPFQELSILLERARLYPERAEAAGLKRAWDSDRIKEILPGGEGIDMAQAYPYPYRGELRMKQPAKDLSSIKIRKELNRPEKKEGTG